VAFLIWPRLGTGQSPSLQGTAIYEMNCTPFLPFPSQKRREDASHSKAAQKAGSVVIWARNLLKLEAQRTSLRTYAAGLAGSQK
jgi:hypothetical protein